MTFLVFQPHILTPHLQCESIVHFFFTMESSSYKLEMIPSYVSFYCDM